MKLESQTPRPTCRQASSPKQASPTCPDATFNDLHRPILFFPKFLFAGIWRGMSPSCSTPSAPWNQPTCNRTPEPTNRRIYGKNCKPGTGNTLKTKFSKNAQDVNLSHTQKRPHSVLHPSAPTARYLTPSGRIRLGTMSGNSYHAARCHRRRHSHRRRRSTDCGPRRSQRANQSEA